MLGWRPGLRHGQTRGRNPESHLPDTPTCPPQDVRCQGGVPGFPSSPPRLSPPQAAARPIPTKGRGHTKCPLPITRSVETLPSRPASLAHGPPACPASPSCSILTWGLARRDIPPFLKGAQAPPCPGLFALAVPLPGPLFPCLTTQPAPAYHHPGLCSMPPREAPPLTLPPHSIP